ncbi:hypothetical protein ACN47E_003983 [Coniothyrium glycines]
MFLFSRSLARSPLPSAGPHITIRPRQRAPNALQLPSYAPVSRRALTPIRIAPCTTNPTAEVKNAPLPCLRAR